MTNPIMGRRLASAAFRPDSVPGLQLWLKADTLALTDGALVSPWLDSSGKGNNATQAASGNRPTFHPNIQAGLPAVLFNGSNQWLNVNNNWTAPALTLAAVVKPLVAGVLRSLFGGAANGIDWNVNSANHMAFNKSQIAGIGSGTATLGTTAFVVVSMTYASPTVSFYLGNSPDGTGSSAQVFSSVTTSVGDAGPGVISQLFNGYVGELLAYDNLLAPGPLTAVQNYLKARWVL